MGKDKCPRCNGKGTVTCSHCGGTGRQGAWTDQGSCNTCKGGKELKCPNCGGKGKV